MPGAPTPFIDTWAPAQFVFGTSGGAGPVRSPDPTPVAAMNDGQTYDPAITYKLAGTIILALVTVFVLQASGFRFVGAASVGVGR